MQTPPIEFDERSIIRWSMNPVTSVQPMIDQWYSYKGQDFQAFNGYWVFNGRNYGALIEIKNAIEAYNKKLAEFIALAADS